MASHHPARHSCVAAVRVFISVFEHLFLRLQPSTSLTKSWRGLSSRVFAGDVFSHAKGDDVSCRRGDIRENRCIDHTESLGV